jgi:hypothetical protein
MAGDFVERRGEGFESALGRMRSATVRWWVPKCGRHSDFLGHLIWLVVWYRCQLLPYTAGFGCVFLPYTETRFLGSRSRAGLCLGFDPEFQISSVRPSSLFPKAVSVVGNFVVSYDFSAHNFFDSLLVSLSIERRAPTPPMAEVVDSPPVPLLLRSL